MEIVVKKINDLIGAEYNPRELTSKQYDDLTNSLKRFGVVDPVLVNINKDRYNIIIGGHQRTKVWRDLGNTEIDCIELDLTLEQEKELNVRLNKNTGQFNLDMLANHFEIDNLIDYGFEDIDFNLLEHDEDETQEVKDNNEFKILCDSSLDLENIKSIFNTGKSNVSYNEFMKLVK